MSRNQEQELPDGLVKDRHPNSVFEEEQCGEYYDEKKEYRRVAQG